MAGTRTLTLIAAGAAALGALAAGGAANAQSAASADARCMALPTASQQIACLREALAAAEGAPSPQTPAPAPEPEESGPGIRIPLPSLGLFGGGEDRAPARPAPALAQDEADAFGAEQLPTANAAAAEDEDARALHATVTAFEAGRRGLLTLELDNGQVWRQTERTGVPLSLSRSRAYAVELTESGFGGYRMRFPAIDRRIVVQRIR